MKTFKITSIAAFASFLLLCAILQSCYQGLEYGTIVKKWYEPQRDYMMLMPRTISNGKTTMTTMTPYYINDNEDWCIKVTGIGTKGDTITRTYYVTPTAYDTLSIGKFICVDGACDKDTNNVKKPRTKNPKTD